MKRKLTSKLWIGGVLLVLAAQFPAAADYRLEKNLELEPGGQLVLHADAGSVTVRGSSRTGAKIVVTSRHDNLGDRLDFTFSEDGPLVRVTARKKEGSSFLSLVRFGSLSLHFEVEVPTETSLDIDTSGGSVKASSLEGTAELETSGGSIGVSALAGSLKAETSGGSIEVEGVEGDVVVGTSGGTIRVSAVTGSLEAETSGGSIDTKDVAGDQIATTSGGAIRVAGAGNLVEAETSGGSIEVSFGRGNAHGGSLSTSGGGIRVVLDPAVSLTVDASTSGGSVTSDLPVKGQVARSSLRGSLGSGGETLKMRTSGGSIRIEGR